MNVFNFPLLYQVRSTEIEDSMKQLKINNESNVDVSYKSPSSFKSCGERHQHSFELAAMLKQPLIKFENQI